MNIKSRLLLLLFDVFCVIYSYDNIEINSLFIHYCIILSTVSIHYVLNVCIQPKNMNHGRKKVLQIQIIYF